METSIAATSGPRLVEALNAVLPHVSTEPTLPAIAGVWFETIDGYLYATATDRYTVGMIRVGPASGELTRPMIVPTRDCRELLKLLKRELQVYISERDDQVIFAGDSTSYTVRLNRDANRPPIRELIANASIGHEDVTSVPRTSMANPRHWARFEKVSKEQYMLIRHPHRDDSRGITVVAIGDDFVGGMSPIRLGADASFPSWLATFASETTKS